MSLYEKFTYRGVTLDRQTIAVFHAAEKKLGYANTLLQGSYHKGVAASGSTHDGGGAFDIIWADVPRKVRAFRGAGHCAFWPRPTLPGVWNKHMHGIVIGNDRASVAAKEQVSAYRIGRNGLASGGSDNWWRPKKITPFNYHQTGLVSWKRLNLIAKAGGKPLLPSGAREVEIVARALQGFGMDIDGHVKGRMDKPLIAAIERFRKIRNVGRTEVEGPLSPQVCYELCIPTREGKVKS